MLSESEKALMKEWCEKYKGHLSLEQISEGIDACLLNARHLLEDGIALFEANRHSRAMSLFIAGVEEVGKVHVLAAMARIPRNNQALWAEHWSDFRSHEYKSTRAIALTYPEEAKARPDLIAQAAMLQYRLSPLAERMRQAGLYVDFKGNGKQWVTPADVPEAEARRWYSWLAKSLDQTEMGRSIGLYSVAALKIQREVFGPINAKRPRKRQITPAVGLDLMRAGFASQHEFWTRMVASGLVDVDCDILVMRMPLKEFLSAGAPA